MTVNIDKKARRVTIEDIVVDESPNIGPGGVETPKSADTIDRAYLSAALDACNKAHTATQLDDAKLDAMVAAKQVEADAIKLCRPVVIEKVAAVK